MSNIYPINTFTPRYVHSTVASSVDMLGRTPSRDGWFTPQCVELKLFFSFIRWSLSENNFGHTFR